MGCEFITASKGETKRPLSRKKKACEFYRLALKDGTKKNQIIPEVHLMETRSCTCITISPLQLKLYYTPFQLNIFQQLITFNDLNSLSQLAFTFYYGSYLIKKDYHKSYQYYELLSKQGYSDGYAGLGQCLIEGKHGNKDIKEGIRLIQLAVNEGNSRGQFILGNCYFFWERCRGGS